MTSTNKSLASSSSSDVCSSGGINGNPPAGSGPGAVPTRIIEQDTPVHAELFPEHPARPNPGTAAAPSHPASAARYQGTATAASSPLTHHADSLLSSILMLILLSCGRDESHRSRMTTMVEAFFKAHDIKTEGDLALVSSDASTFDFALNPVRDITKPVQLGLRCIGGLVERLKESDPSASLSSVTMLKDLIALEKELSDPSHPRINDARRSGTSSTELVNPRDVSDEVSPHGAHGTNFVTAPHKLLQVEFPCVPRGDQIPGLVYQQKVLDEFKKHGVASFLADEALCDKHVAWSVSLGAQIIGKLRNSQSLSYLSVKMNNKMNCARVWATFKLAMNTSNSLENQMWEQLTTIFALQCKEFNDFPAFFGSLQTALHCLNELKSKAIKDETFVRAFIAKTIEVSGLRQRCIDECVKDKHDTQ